jgi:osmotically-inducible protein OsmY
MRDAATIGAGAVVLTLAIATIGCNRTATETETTPPSTATAGIDRESDTQIATAVQARFYQDDTIRGRAIDVSAHNGVVTLRGTVQSQETKQQALTLARSVQGVTSVDDELTVKTASTVPASSAAEGKPQDTAGTAGRADDPAQPGWITTKIQAQYFLDDDIKPWNVDVTTAAGGIVTLEGAVDDAEAKAEALRIARETEGVTRVEDRLRVKSEAAAGAPTDAKDPAGLDQPDAWLTAKIQAKYFLDDDVKGRRIDVDTRNGVVTLKGTVASESERRQAVALARNTDGVRDVTDQLTLDAAASRDATDTRPLEPVDQIARPDPWITTKIQAKYFLDADVKGHRIDVDTNNGVVTLKGTVASAEHKSEAEQIAKQTEGVKRVINQLTVGATDGGRW